MSTMISSDLAQKSPPTGEPAAGKIFSSTIGLYIETSLSLSIVVNFSFKPARRRRNDTT
jgi:hypothetical protein